MTKNDLLELLEAWDNIKILISEISMQPDLLQMLMSIALYNKEHKSWRAAYLVDKIHDNYPELIQPFLGEIAMQLEKEESSSKKRHFLKLISMNSIAVQHQGFLVDYCLNLLTSDKEPPAVRVHAMQVLFNISENEPELKPEILAVIEHEIRYHATAGIISRGSKLAGKLRKQIL
jgi:hypothetical protein